MRTRNFTTPMAALAVALMASGCSHLSDKLDGDIDASSDRMKQLKAGAQPAVAPTVEGEDTLWIARTSVRIEPRDSLPAVFSQPATFDGSVASLTEFAQRITLRSGIPAHVTADALAAPRSAAGDAKSAAPHAASAQAPVRITYRNGNFKGLLDATVARFGVSWRFNDSGIQFYYSDTRSFQIKAIPGDSSLNAAVGSASSDQGGDAGSASSSSRNSNAQKTAVSSKLSVFDGIEKSVAAMLSAQGRVVASPATGTISVTDTPAVLKRVERFIDDQNQALARQVLINVTVLAVSTSDLDDYGINWSLVYKNLSSKYGVKTSYAAETGSSAFSAAILDTANSRWAGSSVMVNALSSQGKVRRETSASVATLNNQPVPVQVARQTSYLKSSSTSLTVNVGSTTTLEPGSVTSGFNMTILPHVLSDGTVMLQFSTDISSLRNLRTVTSNNSTIESPEVDTRNFLQRVAMKSGETLVVSGFEQTDGNLDKQGIGDPAFAALGGGLQARSNTESIVILITPIALGGL